MNDMTLIFDLDGTLLDTLDDLKEAVNHAMLRLDMPARSRDEVRRFVGNGIAALVRRALPEDASGETAAEALALFREYYSTHLNVYTKPYDGILPVLRHARDAGYRIGISSNKIQTAVDTLCEAHFQGLYDLAVGESETIPKKPDPTGTLYLADRLGAVPGRLLYIGDSAVDAATARNTGLPFLWAGWGFRTRSEMGSELPERCFDTPFELDRFLFSSVR